jgi:hypothetical protein
LTAETDLVLRDSARSRSSRSRAPLRANACPIGYRHGVAACWLGWATCSEGFDESMVEAAGLRLLARQGGAGRPCCCCTVTRERRRPGTVWRRCSWMAAALWCAWTCPAMAVPTSLRRPRTIGRTRSEPARTSLACGDEQLGHDRFDLVRPRPRQPLRPSARARPSEGRAQACAPRLSADQRAH